MFKMLKKCFVATLYVPLWDIVQKNNIRCNSAVIKVKHL